MALQLNRRERIGLAAAVLILLTVGMIELVISPLADRIRRLDRTLAAETDALAEMQRLKARYDRLRSEAASQKERMGRRQAGFTLFSFLDSAAGEAQLKDRIAYMKPSTDPVKDTPYRLSRVEMKIQDVSLPELVAFLHRVETAPEAMTVKRLSITQTGKEEKWIEAVLQVETFEL
ncbi:MAG: type II secretion system protein GspM [Desulfobacteraceae bacterium]|jgi:general secretion pathway protein M|nr:type II secretion system protein GspM [Desulfobacteraceae bacterium]